MFLPCHTAWYVSCLQARYPTEWRDLEARTICHNLALARQAARVGHVYA